MPHPKGHVSRVYLGDELTAAVRQKLAQEGRQFSTVVRELLARWVHRPELADAVQMGNPEHRKPVPPAAPRMKKSGTTKGTKATKRKRKP